LVARELIAEARRFADERDAGHLHLKLLGDPPTDVGLARRDVWVHATLPLEGDERAVWSRLKPNVRNHIRQAERYGLTARASRDDLEDFYDVLAANMHRKGAPTYGLALLRAILEVFGDDAELVSVQHEGRVIGGALTIAFRDVVAVPFSSSRLETFKLRPNNFLYWKLIQRAMARGARVFDFGSSMRGTSSLAFKTGWGARETPIVSLVHAPGGPSDATITPDGTWVRAGVELWRHLPRAIADALGPIVCRCLI
jgi:CelD/BcsL family acetyltransferase involved in cellulose biosynthesis